MYYCYIEEAGCTGALVSCTSDVQPVFALCGIIVNQRNIKNITYDFIDIKKKHSPGLSRKCRHNFDNMLWEIKGKEIRKHVRKSGRKAKRNALYYLDKVLSLIEYYNIRIVGLAWIKKPKAEFRGTSIYTRSLQLITDEFNNYLIHHDDTGLLILDSRKQPQNIQTAHSVFTKLFSSPNYDRVLETPVFGNSKNHALLQIVDLITSGLVFPLATNAYCRGHVFNVHVNLKYDELASRFGIRLRNMQYRYTAKCQYRGGINVIDLIGDRRSVDLFFPR
jgi:hypothetical protein